MSTIKDFITSQLVLKGSNLICCASFLHSIEGKTVLEWNLIMPLLLSLIKIINIIYHLQKFPCASMYSLPGAHPYPQTSLIFLSLWISLHFLELSINGIILYQLLVFWVFLFFLFSAWLLSLSILILRSIHAAACTIYCHWTLSEMLFLSTDILQLVTNQEY